MTSTVYTKFFVGNSRINRETRLNLRICVRFHALQCGSVTKSCTLHGVRILRSYDTSQNNSVTVMGSYCVTYIGDYDGGSQ